MDYLRSWFSSTPTPASTRFGDNFLSEIAENSQIKAADTALKSTTRFNEAFSFGHHQLPLEHQLKPSSSFFSWNSEETKKQYHTKQVIHDFLHEKFGANEAAKFREKHFTPTEQRFGCFFGTKPLSKEEVRLLLQKLQAQQKIDEQFNVLQS